ncbi:MAG: hypothetical protein A3H28_16875 [Acidobacteria bacterium RIFCSPLOWO2_02_FULL_61_28]|nr:MAG: hypothetical protein A3H28_16875 [Acidobacteria bacterium RIFCSPLOWO2_02_FULL_61_28]
MNYFRRGQGAATWVLLAALTAAGTTASARQQPGTERAPGESAAAGQAVQPDKGQAYYHFTLGHLYQERGTLFNRPDLLSKAIEEFKLALLYDPASSFLGMELADLYAMTGRWRSAMDEAEQAVNRNPDDAEARRLLGRLYLRMLTADRRQPATADLQQRAIQQFEQIAEKYPRDSGSLLILAQLYRVSGENTKAEETLKKAVALDPNSADANTQLALLYVDLGQYRAAIELLTKVTAQNADPQVLSSLAYAYEQVRDYKSAADAYGRALERDPENLAFRKALGQSLLYSQQYDRALEQFQVAVRANPRDAEAFLRLSQIYRFQNKFDLARENLDKALDLSPDNQELQYNQVLLAEAEGKLPEAVSLVRKILDSPPRDGGTAYTPQDKTNRGIFLEKLGTLHRDQNHFAEAADAFRQMIALDGEVAVRGEARLIETYQENREYENALRESERAVRQHPENRELVMTRASLLASTGDTAAGVNLLSSLLKNTDEDREIWLALAQVNLRGKQFAPAIEALAKAEPFSQSDEEKSYIQFLYGSVWERQKQFEKAEGAFRNALSLNPDSPNSLNYLGYMMADRGVRLDEAVSLIERALERDPNNGAYLDSLGWAYFKQNRLDLAEQYLRRSLERVPNDPTIHDHLGDVYYKIGRIREAQQEWKTALEQWRRLPKNEIEPDEIARIEQKLKEANTKLAQETPEPRR